MTGASSCALSVSTSEDILLTELLLPPHRLARWVENFSTRHGEAVLSSDDGTLAGEGSDGSTFTVDLPWDRSYGGPPDVASFIAASEPPIDWGVLLVRRGGFAVARLSGREYVGSKVGSRHVQGRTRAGGQSQQRFARRRDNQARVAYEAAASYAVQVLGDVPLLVVGGDRAALEYVLDEPVLASAQVVGRSLAVPGDPRRKELEAAVGHAASLHIRVINR